MSEKVASNNEQISLEKPIETFQDDLNSELEQESEDTTEDVTSSAARMILDASAGGM